MDPEGKAGMSKTLKRIAKASIAFVLVAAAAVAGYIVYMQVNYNRIADNQPVTVQGNAAPVLRAGRPYTAVTYNIGFGAYTPDFSFFMEEGLMADGTKTKGSHGTAASEQSVLACTHGAIVELYSLEPDFILFQEVDTDSTRSYYVDQKAMLEDAFPELGSSYGVNFHSAFIAYPILDMHGTAHSGLLTLTGTYVREAQRRSYPVDESFPEKFFDLDRCFLIDRIPVDNGRQLVLINTHMSAYDEGGAIRAQQFKMLNSVLEQERAAGNYVIVGGDWNHALCGSLKMYESEQLPPPWLAVFDDSLLAEGFRVVRPGNLEEVATCRGSDIAYEKGVTYEATIDGFIISDNVTATAENIDTGYAYSDHNPVKMTFTLKI